MKSFRAEILAIGSELLHGGRVDSNSLFIADTLAHCGIRVSKKVVLSDEQADIQEALRSSSKDRRNNTDLLMNCIGILVQRENLSPMAFWSQK